MGGREPVGEVVWGWGGGAVVEAGVEGGGEIREEDVGEMRIPGIPVIFGDGEGLPRLIWI